ncbi:carbohydrate ABC transporter permease [Nucisporomicrobium flavum]|jgi:multiple sugar transport system permease protein|uniref:carbohydrate ABC transporter permease n=1 Tax=Nucisporomicrobium flavum TaxID=2785915 RepID=UPI0018F67F68|nr:carbohydrate ABC transporter permease [Nucisporomicrobium flavum]
MTTIRPPAARSMSRLLVPALAVVIAVWAGLPLLWMLLTAFKPDTAIRTSHPTISFTPTLDNFRNLFLGGNRVGAYLVNSLVVTGVSTVIAVVLGCLAGYGLTHWASRYKRDVAFWVLSTRMAPIAAVLVPLFVMFRGAGLVNTIPGLVLAHLSFNLPFAIWLMSAFFARIPESVEEAALLDGCTKWRRFRTVSLPMARAGIVTTAVLCMVFSWNDYAFSSALSGPDTATLPQAAGALVTQSGIDWGLLSALAVVVAVPMLIAGLAVRRHLVSGLSLGAVTGE